MWDDTPVSLRSCTKERELFITQKLKEAFWATGRCVGCGKPLHNEALVNHQGLFFCPSCAEGKDEVWEVEGFCPKCHLPMVDGRCKLPHEGFASSKKLVALELPLKRELLFFLGSEEKPPEPKKSEELHKEVEFLKNALEAQKWVFEEKGSGWNINLGRSQIKEWKSKYNNRMLFTFQKYEGGDYTFLVVEVVWFASCGEPDFRIEEVFSGSEKAFFEFLSKEGETNEH